MNLKIRIKMSEKHLMTMGLHLQQTSFLQGQGWALKMFDASAKLPPPGMLQGTLHFPGNFDSCLEVMGPGFTGKYVGLTFVEKSEDNPMNTKSQQTVVPMKFPTNKMILLKEVEEEDEEDPLAILKSGQVKLGRCIPSVCGCDIWFSQLLHK